MAETDETVLRMQLVTLLKGGSAHATFADAVKGFPLERTGEQPAGLPYSAWQLVEHMRIAVHDLLEFSTNSDYVDLRWPDDYWPKQPRPSDDQSWERSVSGLEADLTSFESLVKSPDSNLYATIPWGQKGETLLREVLLAAAHTSYHIGELILLRRVMGIWKS